MEPSNEQEKPKPVSFIRDIIDEDLQSGKHTKIITRFPPEPNGYLHIGHAKSICLNFGLARDYQGTCHLRFDDTNPSKEEQEYVDSIQESIKWLGFDWKENKFFASDYFDQLYLWAEELIQKGLAYVCDLTTEQMQEYRGTGGDGFKPGKESPTRNRPPAESLEIFRRMKAGEFEDGKYVLRAKIDMSSPNINMRDPVIYRIMHEDHHRTGNKWCLYPMYDFAHPLSDAIEKITHSICTLEFEIHRPLYDWCVQNCSVPAIPRQIEFARLNLTYTMMSKRKLLLLVQKKLVNGWDDPRMPTIAGLRRRGYTPEAIRDFCDRIGVAKADSTVDIALLEHCLREDLNKRAPRVMAVLNPLKVVITNYPEGQVEELDVPYHPEQPAMGTRKVPFSRENFIEQEDFFEVPPKGFFRLSPGKEVRLANAYYVTCTNVVKDAAGKIVEVHCTYDPQTRGGWSQDGRKVKGTIHWVSAKHAIDAEVRLFDHLFTTECPDASADDLEKIINPKSLIVQTAKVEPSVTNTQSEQHFQFMRSGYFCTDRVDSKPGRLVFNRVVSLKDSWRPKGTNA
jgi:glutaminyl-tRNA synthetase